MDERRRSGITDIAIISTLLLIPFSSGNADDLSSASFTARAGHFSASGSGVLLKAGGSAGVLLPASRGAVVEAVDPAQAESLLDLFFELEVEGAKLYNHDPVRVLADTECIPADASYLHLSGCVPLFDDPAAGVQVGNLVTLEPSTNRCGNDIAGDQEECDGSDDASCPGQCQTNCSCP